MKSQSQIESRSKRIWPSLVATCLCWLAPARAAAAQGTTNSPPSNAGISVVAIRAFTTPQRAADALIEAAEGFDVGLLEQIFGPAGEDIIFSGEPVRDRQLAQAFAAEGRKKTSIAMDPQGSNRAFLLVGEDDWPFPVPLVHHPGGWIFDAQAGRQEMLNRRVGRNELDAIEICHGYVEAQQDFAEEKRQGYDVNQYAQRIISTPGKQDGLAWQNPDGTWGGPLGEKVARAIEQGYSPKVEPYHGYYFKVLKGQGPDAPLGQMDYVIKGVMIGGFALVAAPAEYGVTGVKSFIVSNDGVVYQKDLGPESLDTFMKMERFNPDKAWDPVEDDDE